MIKNKIDKNKDSMLYLIHIDWSWIKQRPQFLSYELLEYFNLTLFFPKNYRSDNIVNSNIPKFVNSFYKLPFQRFKNLSFFSFLNMLFILLQLSNKLKKSEYIWLTSPEIYGIIKNKISKNHKLIYDCMDDILEFPNIKNNVKLSEEMYFYELGLISRADIVFSSSKYLKNTLIDRYKIDSNKIDVINNAISIKMLNNKIANSRLLINSVDKIKTITYIGTISKWFDFDLLLDCLNENQHIRFLLLGPKEVTIPCHDRLIYQGIIKHNEVFSYMKSSDALIMPFIVNDLIKSVNPVKLYEYILSLKPIITCYYDEIDKFKDYVHYYKSPIELKKLFVKLVNNELQSNELAESINFLNENTWKSRGIEIVSKLQIKKLYDL